MARIPLRTRKPLPVAGLKTAWPAEALDPTYSPRALNVRFRLGRILEGPGKTIVSGFPGGGSYAIYEIGSFTKLDGTVWPFMLADNGKLYRWGNGAPANPRQWHASSPAMTGGTGRFSTASGEDRMFITRLGVSQIWEWAGGTTLATAITATDGTVPQAKFLEYFNDHLLAAYTVEGGVTYVNRVRFADNGDYTKWGSGASGFTDIFAPRQEAITGMKILGARCTVYRRRSIIDLYPTGQASLVFAQEVRVNGMGCGFPYTLASNGERHFFLGPDKTVYTWDGTQLQDLSTDRIEDQLKALVSDSSENDHFGAVWISNHEYWLVLSTGDIFVYDYVRDTWSRDSFGNLTALGEVLDSYTAETFNSITTTWDTETRTWDQMLGTQFARFFGGRSTGATFIVDDTTSEDYFSTIGTDRYVETADMYFPNIESQVDADPWAQGTVQRVILLYDYTTADPVEIGVSTDRGRTWTTQQVIPHESGISFADFNKTGPIVRFRFRENNDSGRFRWNSYGFEWVPAGPSSPSGSTS